MFRAELLGLVTTTATKVAAAAAVVGLALTQVVFVTVLPALARGDIGPGRAALGADLPDADLTSAAQQLDALSPMGASLGGGSLGIVALAVTVLGVVAGTSDFRYGGIVLAALASPRRGRIMAAKAAATGALGVALGLVLAVVSTTTLLVTLAVSGTPLELAAGDLVAVAARGALAVACLTLLGLAVGVVLRNQLAAVVTLLGVLLLEPMVAAAAQLVAGSLPTWTQLMPLTLAQATVGGGSFDLAPLVAGAALVGLAAAATLGAAATLRRNDV